MEVGAFYDARAPWYTFVYRDWDATTAIGSARP